MKELWKPITGFEGLYSVSNLGKVRSERRIVNSHEKGMPYSRAVGGLVLKPALDNYGYPILTLCKDGKKYTKTVHRLVAIEFVQNPDGENNVNHKDENKTNNKASNLEWCSVKYNNIYGNGMIKRAKTRGIPIVAKNRQTGEELEFYSQGQAARELKLNQANINSCLKGTYKYTGNYTFKYL